MALTHVIDTSVLTRLRVPVVNETVRPLASARQLGRAGISDLEIGFSARNAAEWDQLVDALSVFPLVETDRTHVRRARQVQRMLAAAGHRGRKLPDLLIAAAAEDAGLGVLHYDGDFDLIGAVTGQSTRWVVPAGSID